MDLAVAVSPTEWLRQLYGFADGWVNLFAIERATRARLTAWAPASQTDPLDEHVAAWAGRCDVYFGVATRHASLPGNQRGGAEDCYLYPGLWVDIDIQSDTHRLPNLPSDRDTAVQLIRAFPLEPTASVHTGHGWHAWWLFAEPVARQEMEVLLVRWRVTWKRLAQERGLHIDDVWDLPRVMRLPGTDNKGLMVVARAFFGRRYSPTDIEEQLDPAPERPKRTTVATAHLAGSRFNEKVTAAEVLTEAGWELLDERRQPRSGDRHWHHPGSANEISATVYEDGYTCIWSETVAATTGCTVRDSLSSWALYTFLFHRGDFTVSHREALKMFPNLELPRELPPANGKVEVAGPKLELVTVRLDRVQKVKPRYLWRPWLPTPKLVILDGAPEVGKSTLSMDLAARISTGAPMPDGSGGGAGADVVLLSAEDEVDDTTAWRLEAAGADMSRIHFVDHVLIDGQPDLLGLPTHVDLLVEYLGDVHAVLVVIDVLMSYLDDHIDASADAKSRRALLRLKNELRTVNCSALMLRHPRKTGGPAIVAGGGSIAFSSTVRANWVAGWHPEDETLRVLCSVKNNMAVRPVPQGFRLVPAADPESECAQVVWIGPCPDVDADQLTDPALTPREDGPKTAEARAAIRELLKPGESMWTKEFNDELKKLHISQNTIDAARRKEGVQSVRTSAIENGKVGWKVWLPQSVPDLSNRPDKSDEAPQSTQVLPFEDPTPHSPTPPKER